MLVQGLTRAAKQPKTDPDGRPDGPVDDHSKRQKEYMEAGFTEHYAKMKADKDRAEEIMRRRAEEMQAEMPLSRAERVLDWVQDATTGYVEGTSKYIGQAAGAGPGLLLGGIGGATVTDGSFEGFAAGAALGGFTAAHAGGKVGEATGGWAAKTSTNLMRNLAGLPRRVPVPRRRQIAKGPTRAKAIHDEG